MTTRKTLLDRVEIVSPCTADWNAMKGTDEVRFCSDCRKYVYNLSEMTRREADLLLSTRGNQMCARLIRDLEGQTVTVESLPPIRLMSWKPGPVANAAVSALISIVPLGIPLASTKVPSHDTHSVDSRAKRPLPAGMQSAIAGVVSDENDTPIVGALVTIITESSGEILSQLTDDGGQFRFDGLDPRTYSVEVCFKGYEIAAHHGVILQQGEARRLNVAMEKYAAMAGAGYIPPQPLRMLYENSDRIVVAQVGKSIVVSKEGHDVQYRTSLGVVQTIKGDGHKPIINIDNWVYGGQSDLIEGKTMLAFLERDEAPGMSGRDTYQLVSTRESAKYLSANELETYIKRLEELKAIVSDSEYKSSDVVEWLVLCAEDPVTRREGAFELNTSAQRDLWEKRDRARRAEAGETLVPQRKSAQEEDNFGALLTDEQRERLANALYKSEEFGNGDFELIELISCWNDARLLPFLISYLQRQLETAPPKAQQVMQFVVDALEDENVNKLLHHYLENASYDDVYVEDEDTDDDESADEVSSESKQSEQASNTDDQEDATPKLRPEAARQARVQMLRSFLNAVQAHFKIESVK